MDERGEARKALAEYGSLHNIAREARKTTEDVLYGELTCGKRLRAMRLLRALEYLTLGTHPTVLPEMQHVTTPNRW